MENRLIAQFKGFLDTPPLWEESGPFGIDQFSLPQAPTPLPTEKAIQSAIPSLSRNFVMGKRMESFFSYLVKNSSEYHLMAENLQISRDRITVGEIDFIVEEVNGNNRLHIELVYKFYVYDPAFKTEEERWIGPNRKDSLLRKIKKLKENQFPLIYRTETRELLTSLKIFSKNLEQKVCFKANLFVPREMLGKDFPLINNSCICGYWIHLDEFNSNEFSGNMFYAPKKPDWPVDPEANEEWYSFALIYEKVIDLHTRKFSPLLWMKTPSGKVERFFVVWW